MSQQCLKIWRKRCCYSSIESPATPLRRIHTSSPRSAEEQLSAHSPRAQDTTEELSRHFDIDSLRQNEDIRKLDASLPNSSFRRNPFRYSNTRKLNLDHPISASAPAQARPSSESQSQAQASSQTQQTPRPLFRYENTGQPSPPNINTRPTRTVRPLPAGAIDLRSLSARPAQAPAPPASPSQSESQSTSAPSALSRLTQRSPPRQYKPKSTRSTGAYAGLHAPRSNNNNTDKRGTQTTTPRSRPRQPRPSAFSATSLNRFDSESVDISLTEEEEEYAREREEVEMPKEMEYKPAAVTLESLSGMGPGLPVVGGGEGVWGQEEAVGDWVEGIGRKRKVQRLNWMGGGVTSTVTEKGVEAEEEGDGKVAEALRREFDTRRVAEKMFRGEYVFDGREDQGVLGTLRRQAVLNASYYPKDGQSLAEKVRSLLPAEQTRGGGKGVRT